MTSGLATLVAGIWTEAGYETTISHRNGDTYVLAEHESDGTYDLLWILDDDERITVPHLDRFRQRIADLSVEDAYVVSPRSVDQTVERAAAERGLEAVGIGTLRTLAEQSGVGQVAVDAALATTVGPDETHEPQADAPTEDDEDEATADEDAESEPIDLTDPQRQAEIRQRLAVMIGKADPDDDPAVDEHGPGESGAEDPLDGLATADDEAEEGGSILDDSDAGDGDDGEDSDATVGADGDAGGDGEAGADDALAAAEATDPLAGNDPLGDDLADVPDAEETTDSEGPLKSRRGVITGGVAAVLTAGVLDLAVFNVVLGADGGGMPAYNETRVKSEAQEYPPDAILSAPAQFEEAAVTYGSAVPTAVAADGNLWSVTLAVGGGTVVGRWDGDEPTIGTRYTVWGVVTGTTTVEGEAVPTIDVVDMVAADGGGGGGGETTASGSGTTGGGGTTSGATTTSGGG